MPGHRRLRRLTRSGLSVLASFCLFAGLLAVIAPAAAPDVLTNAKDNSRAGWYSDQAGLAPGLVAGNTFGQQFSAAVDGQVYAQPLVAAHTLLVATETNNVYGLDPATGAQRWTRNLGPWWNPADLGCGDLAPSVGVTGTPVVDPSTNTMYLFSKTYLSGSSGAVAWYAHALDVTTGAERPGFPVLISGNASNDPTVPFTPRNQMQRPGLLLLNGVVYAGFGGHCDYSPYQGWVVGVSTAGRVTTLWSDETGGGNGAGIWQSGGGLVSDGPGQIVLSTGNGSMAAAPTPGKTPPSRLGQAVVRLAVQANGSLVPTDFFSPYDAPTLNTWDADLGSGSPIALPAQFGTPAHPKLMMEVGKQGELYVLDSGNLGGFGQGPSGGDAVVSRAGPDGGVWGKPAAWPGDGGYVYVTTASAGTTWGGTVGALHAYRYGVDGTGNPALSLAGASSDAFGLSSSPPVVTSDGTTSGSALVWVVYAPDNSGSGAQLRAYLPVPVGGALKLVKSWPIGTSSKFNPPAVDGNRVYVGTRDGHVLGFGSPVSTPMTASPVTWPATTVGQSSVQTATLTATTPLTVTAVATSKTGFAVGSATPVLPAALAAGQSLRVPVTFTPPAVGQYADTLTVTTSIGPVRVSLNGYGQPAAASIAAAPGVVSFGGVVVGASRSANVVLSNTGAQPLTISASTALTAPFSAAGVPATGYVLAPDSSVTVTVSFAPTAAGSSSGVLSLDTTAGPVDVALTGSAASPPHLSVTPATVALGSVALGATVTRTFQVSNTGGSPLTLTRSKPPVAGVGFRATSSLSEGTTLAAGATVTETVQFTAQSLGSVADSWQLGGDDGSGVHTVSFAATGVDAKSVPPPDAGWRLNGSSVLAGGVLRLTDATTANSAGSAFWPTAVLSSYLDVSFDSAIDSGTGAAGLTLALADPARGALPTAVGASGSGLGCLGIPGLCVALDTYRTAGSSPNNFVGVANGAGSWLATSTAVPPLRGTVRHVRVVVSGGTLTLWIDGVRVLSTGVTLGARTLVGFTGANGSLTDRHAVSNVLVRTAAPVSAPPAFVQQVSAHQPKVSRLTAVLAKSDTLNNRLVVEVGVYSTTHATARTVTDSAGDVFTEVLHFIGSDHTEQSVWTAPITHGGVRPTITVTPTAAADTGFVVLEYSGLSVAAGTAAVDRIAHRSATTTSAATVRSGATLPTTATSELALGLYTDSGPGAAIGAGSGFTSRAGIIRVSDIELRAEDQLIGATRTAEATVPTGARTVWLLSTVVFKHR